MFISSLYNTFILFCLNSFADHKYRVIEYSVLPCSAGLRFPVYDFQTSNKGITWELTEKVYSQALPHSYPVKTPKVIFQICVLIFLQLFSMHTQVWESLLQERLLQTAATVQHLLWKVKFQWSTVTPILPYFLEMLLHHNGKSWVVVTGNHNSKSKMLTIYTFRNICGPQPRALHDGLYN